MRRGCRLVLALALALPLALAGCRGAGDGRTTIRFWAMGREGEVVQELVRDFERENPAIRVVVQQIPWGAAHEKLLTAHVGRSTPDVAQLGNTWIAEFTALRAIEPLDRRIAATPSVRPDDYFKGIWDTNVMDGVAYGIPWYVDTRVLFYRRDLLARAGYDSMPGSWDVWRRAMEAVQRVAGKDRFAIFLPTNEYTPWIVFGMQAGSPLLRDGDTRGAFSGPAYRRAATFYLDLFERGLAPAVQGASIANPTRSSSAVRSTCTSAGRGTWVSSGAGSPPHCSPRGPPHRSPGPTALPPAFRPRVAPAWCCSAPRGTRMRHGGWSSSSHGPNSSCASGA